MVSGTGSGLDLGSNPGIGLGPDSVTGSGLDSGIGSGSNSRLDSGTNSGPGSELGLELDSGTDPGLGSGTGMMPKAGTGLVCGAGSGLLRRSGTGLALTAGVRRGLVHGVGISFKSFVGARESLVQLTGTGLAFTAGAGTGLVCGVGIGPVFPARTRTGLPLSRMQAVILDACQEDLREQAIIVDACSEDPETQAWTTMPAWTLMSCEYSDLQAVFVINTCWTATESQAFSIGTRHDLVDACHEVLKGAGHFRLRLLRRIGRRLPCWERRTLLPPVEKNNHSRLPILPDKETSH